MNLKQFLLCAVLLSVERAGAHPENIIVTVTDDEFIKLLLTKQHLITLFTKENCVECDVLEREMLSIQNDLERLVSGNIVKIYNSSIVAIYNPKKEPTLVFFRYGEPLLHYGSADGGVILQTFLANKEPIITELSDKNFEHITEAASGSATGDWFVMFYGGPCQVSRHLIAKWETVAAALRTKMNVGRLNINKPGYFTGKRFAVISTPSFIVFHRGIMYRYKSRNQEIDDLINFAMNFRRIVIGDRIPKPLSPLEFYVDMVTRYILGDEWYFGTGIITIGLGLFSAAYTTYSKVGRGVVKKEIH